VRWPALLTTLRSRRAFSLACCTDSAFIGVLLAACEVCLQRIKPAPPDKASPRSGPGDPVGLTVSD
jgi:hypothetical protein